MGQRKGRRGVGVEAGRESLQRRPEWFGEAVLVGKYWLGQSVDFVYTFKNSFYSFR